jgi:hypothetical protein
MGNRSLIFGIGSAAIAAVLALLVFAWSKDSMAASQDTVATASRSAIATDSSNRLIRVVLASPFAR